MMWKWLSKVWPVLILLALTGIVAWQNITPNTFLTGWDNLHPEFDFKTNIVDRGIKGVWQYYQELGVPSGNAHVADIPRQLSLWIASAVIPVNYLRYGYHLFAWFAGGLGIYILLSQLLLGDLSYRQKQIAALAGAVFYLFNLGTLQTFYAPYEAFSHFYMMLPWLLLATWNYLDNGTRRNLGWLLLVNILAVPMSYIPTIFVVYVSVIGLIGIAGLLDRKTRNIKRVALCGAVILAVNAFWLMPFVHFVASGTDAVVESKINQMFTDEAFLRNQEYGELDHSLIMEGFWFDTTDLKNNAGEHDLMMRPWIDYIENPGVKPGMWILTAAGLIGIIYGLIFKKKHAGVIALIFAVGLIALINDNPPTGNLFRLLQEKLPLFGQVLRLPYTKFVYLMILGYAAGIAWFVELVFRHRQKFGYTAAVILLTLILFVQKPVFAGNLFYDNLRVNIPSEYFQLFKFFQQEDRYRGRIANLPQPTFWGWSSYEWGYRGSGFPWYGIPQPILDRNFDVWSPEGEKYYSELSQALYDQEDEDALLGVFDKYGVDYVWIDAWVSNPFKPELLNMEAVNNILTENGYNLVFEGGKQRVFKRNIPVVQEGWVNNTSNQIGENIQLTIIRPEDVGDSEFVRFGSDVWTRAELPREAVEKGDGRLIYGFRLNQLETASLTNIVKGQEYKLLDGLGVKSWDNRIWWMRNVKIEYDSPKGADFRICLHKLNQPCYFVGVDENESDGYRWGLFELAETVSPDEIYFRVEGDVRARQITFGYFDTPSLEVPLIIRDEGIADIKIELTRGDTEPVNCYLFGKGWFNREVLEENGGKYVRYSAYDASSCESRLIGNSDLLVLGGTLEIESRNIEGRPVKICLRHDPPGDCLVEEILLGGGGWKRQSLKLPVVTVPGDLYLEIDDYAVGNEVRVNDIREVMIRRGINPGETSKDALNQRLFTNNQAYRDGWLGVAGGQVLPRVAVNDWANGWIIEDQDVNRVVIMYWPQLLEYLGFAILGVTIFAVLKKQK